MFLLKRLKEFEELFLLDLERKHPEVLAGFKAGKLEQDHLDIVEQMANDLSSQYK